MLKSESATASSSTSPACGRGARSLRQQGGDRLQVRLQGPPGALTRSMHMNKDKLQSAAQKAIGNFAPKLVELTDEVLFGDIWERPQLSKRDRSLITCAALVAMGKTEQMTFHFPRAIENGVTEEELVELITHLAFYAGWPNAMSAVTRAKELLQKKEEGRT